MEASFGPEQGPTPIGDRKSLEILQKEVMKREQAMFEAKVKMQLESQRRANEAQNR